MSQQRQRVTEALVCAPVCLETPQPTRVREQKVACRTPASVSTMQDSLHDHNDAKAGSQRLCRRAAVAQQLTHSLRTV